MVYSWEYPPLSAVSISEDIAYSWDRCDRADDSAHTHTIDCLWVWHNCGQVLGPDTVAPGETFGWRPSGVGLHTLVQLEPLTITASVYWPDCCGVHGFITDGRWVPA